MKLAGGATGDTCEACGTFNEPFNVNGTPDTGAQNWATYVCGGAGKGSASDGCGRNWSVTTKAGLAHNEAVGTDTLGKVTPDVATNRSYFTGSDLYRANYERIFGHA